MSSAAVRQRGLKVHRNVHAKLRLKGDHDDRRIGDCSPQR